MMLAPRTRGRTRDRHAYVLIAVLIVIVVLSLVAYRFTDSMTTEYRAGVRTADMAQARAAAVSGIHYVAGILADPASLEAFLGDPTQDNVDYFADITVHYDSSKPNKESRFRIVTVAVVGPGVYEPRYALTDEGGKLNPNALIALDKSGEVLYNALMKLPNMESDIADAIVDWVDADDTPRAGGAESSTYESYANPYRAKNKPLNSLDELLLVKGVTPQLLYGNDRNRNGIDDDGGPAAVDRGWADYLTVHSREINVDSAGALRVWMNHDDIVAVYKALLAQGLDAEMSAYIMAAKLWGTTQLDAEGNPITKGGGGGGGKGGGGKGGGGKGGGGKGGGGKGGGDKGGQQQQKVRVAGADELITAVEKALDTASSSGRAVNSIFDLMNTRVTLPRTGGGTGGGFGTGGQQETVVVNCPLNNPERLNSILPVLLDRVCPKEAVEMIPRLNVNSAPREVVLGLPGVTETEADAIVANREGLIAGDSATVSGAWLVTTGALTPARYRALERYVTGSTMVYRVESIGYLAGGGPAVRVEAVIDVNQGSPRVLFYRELTDLDYPRAFQPEKN